MLRGFVADPGSYDARQSSSLSRSMGLGILHSMQPIALYLKCLH